MEIERAIAILETGYDMPPFSHTEAEVDEACHMACEALREKLEQEKEEPLTLEEVREMDGLPVWLAYRTKPEEAGHGD